MKRGWKLYLEALTPLLGIVKGVPFTHESGNFDKTSTRRVYVRRRFKVPTFVEHVIHPSSEIEERNVRDKKAKHEETLPTFPASYKNFENSVLFSTRKYSQGLLNPPNSPQLRANKSNSKRKEKKISIPLNIILILHRQFDMKPLRKKGGSI